MAQPSHGGVGLTLSRVSAGYERLKEELKTVLLEGKGRGSGPQDTETGQS